MNQMLLNKRQKEPDYIIIISTFILLILGLLAVYSATIGNQEEAFRDYFNRQLLWVGIGLILAIIFAVLPLRILKEWAFRFYVMTVIILLLGVINKGLFESGRWIQIGGLTWQPSEFAKLVVILALARFLGDRERSPNSKKVILLAFAITLIPFLLIAQQPDLATAFVFFAILLPMLFWAGLRSLLIFVIMAPVITFVASFNYYTFTIVMVLISAALFLSRRSALVFWSVFLLNITVGIIAPVLWSQLRPYQQQRVLAYLGVVSDPQGVGYQILQSKVAIGSGGLFGKGFLNGTQSHLQFLPAQHTDFIISVFAEEFGFFAIMMILIVYLILLFRGLKIAAAANDRFASLSIIGIVFSLTFQIFVNIGMVTGIVPVAGLPLPFMSYGGSSMTVSLIMIALIYNVASKR